MKEILKNISYKMMLFVCILLISGSAIGTLQVEAASVKLSATKKTIKKEESFTLTLKNYNKGESVKWRTSDENVVSIKKVSKRKYKITGKKAGKATITVKAGGKKYKCTVTVKASKQQVKKAYKQLQRWIETKGRIGYGGNKTVSDYDEDCNYYIAYDKAAKNFVFIMNFGEESEQVTMTISQKDYTKAKIEVTHIYSGIYTPLVFVGETTIETKTYSSKKPYPRFNFDRLIGFSNSEAQTEAGINLHILFDGIQSAMLDDIGLTFEDLGFENL